MEINTGDRAVMLFVVFEWPKYECSNLMKKEVNHFYIYIGATRVTK